MAVNRVMWRAWKTCFRVLPRARGFNVRWSTSQCTSPPSPATDSSLENQSNVGTFRSQSSQFQLKLVIPYKPYLNAEEVTAGLTHGSLFIGKLRIPRASRNVGFISDQRVESNSDILVEGLIDRNRAMDGDDVVYRLNPRNRWKRTEQGVSDDTVAYQKTGHVVAIYEKNNVRRGAYFPLCFLKSSHVAVFSAVDLRNPRVMVSLDQLPKDIHSNYQHYSRQLFGFSIVDWQHDDTCAQGKFEELFGDREDVAVMEEGLMYSANLAVAKPFSEEVLKEIEDMTADVTKEEMQTRKDFRSRTVFSIDPLNSRDYDDALHWHSLGGGKCEVGVHVADVSHYVQPRSHLDRRMSSACFTTYLLSRAKHLLPSRLSEDLCSLRHGVDRRVMSCIFTFNSSKEVIDTWMGPGLICSKARLSYGQADVILAGDMDSETWSTLDVTREGMEPVVASMLQLSEVTAALRKVRCEEGFLSVDCKPASFVCNEKGEPCEVAQETHFVSSQLVEEMMLLANATVAKYLSRTQPNVAVFRSQPHPPPSKGKDFFDWCKLRGLENCVHLSSNPRPIMKFLNSLADHPLFGAVQLKLVMSLERARYSCLRSSKTVHHSALNMAHYTHFTSPIRRFPDLLVHRQLKAALAGVTLPPSREFEKLLEHCNSTDEAADHLSKEFFDLYFGAYIRVRKEIRYEGIVLSVTSLRMKVHVVSLMDSFVVLPSDSSPSEGAKSDDASPAKSSFSVFKPNDVVQVLFCHRPSVANPYAFSVQLL